MGDVVDPTLLVQKIEFGNHTSIALRIEAEQTRYHVPYRDSFIIGKRSVELQSYFPPFRRNREKVAIAQHKCNDNIARARPHRRAQR